MSPNVIRVSIALLSIVVIGIGCLPSASARWAQIAVHTIVGSLLGGLAASIFASFDWRSALLRAHLQRDRLRVVATALFVLIVGFRWFFG